MRTLITGNMGYIGSFLVPFLRERQPSSTLYGLDIGLFKNELSILGAAPEQYLTQQYDMDIRDADMTIPKGDVCIHLAAVSNDPMGNSFDLATDQINFEGTVNMAMHAKAAGYKVFIMASSCSVYGFSDGKSVNEESPVNPLTAYARTKYEAEQAISRLADDDFHVVCLRFSTACGFSPRLRLDLVLNDFVANAFVKQRIDILSDGTAWRPLISVEDMSRAFEWAALNYEKLPPFEVFNVGSESWNYTIRDLAYEVKNCMPGCVVDIQGKSNPDNRSYRVNFEKFQRRAPEVLPSSPIQKTIRDLKNGLEDFDFQDPNFRDSRFMRLNVLNDYLYQDKIDPLLSWRY